jgi:hypothetical protein
MQQQMSRQQADGTNPQQQAAEQLFRARQSQQRAAAGDPAAAREAAEALAQANDALRRQDASNPASSNQTAAKPDQNPSKTGQTPFEATGIRTPGKPLEDHRPSAVKDIGISPSDWARLPPGLQEQLLNAAQQKGPPAYQEMIKSYYVRIAHLQAAAGSTP